MTTSDFLQSLQGQLNEIVSRFNLLADNFSDEELNAKRTGWNAIQCLDHLNLYAAYYLPVISKAMNDLAEPFHEKDMKYSWVGGYSVRMMNPKNAKKQTTFKNMQPTAASPKDVIKNFRFNQVELASLLTRAKTLDITRGKVKVEFFKLLKMNIGEALEFVIVHEMRHLLQAENSLKTPYQVESPLIV